MAQLVQKSFYFKLRQFVTKKIDLKIKYYKNKNEKNKKLIFIKGLLFYVIYGNKFNHDINTIIKERNHLFVVVDIRSLSVSLKIIFTDKNSRFLVI